MLEEKLREDGKYESDRFPRHNSDEYSSDSCLLLVNSAHKICYNIPKQRPNLLFDYSIVDYLQEFMFANDIDFKHEDLIKKEEPQLLAIFFSYAKKAGLEPPYGCTIPGRTIVPYTRKIKNGRRKLLHSFIEELFNSNEFKLPTGFSKFSEHELRDIYFKILNRYEVIPRRDAHLNTKEFRELDNRVIVNLYR